MDINNPDFTSPNAKPFRLTGAPYEYRGHPLTVWSASVPFDIDPFEGREDNRPAAAYSFHFSEFGGRRVRPDYEPYKPYINKVLSIHAYPPGRRFGRK